MFKLELTLKCYQINIHNKTNKLSMTSTQDNDYTVTTIQNSNNDYWKKEIMKNSQTEQY